MCILFIHNGSRDPRSDYRLIVASNRDEFYDRPTSNLAQWAEDLNVIGGRDLEAGCDGGAWLAVSPLRRKLGVLLNLPTSNNPIAKSRGRIVADFVKSDSSVDQYVKDMTEYAQECNHFNFVAVDIGEHPKIQTYSNFSNKIDLCEDSNFGMSNSLIEVPLKKVTAGIEQLGDICSKYNKTSDKNTLIEQLFGLLKSTEQHLPDPVLESSRPDSYEPFSSIYVHKPEARYGTRTHTIILITKTGHMEIIESTMQAPVNVNSPKWEKTEMKFDLPL